MKIFRFLLILLARIIFWPLIIAGMIFTVFNIMAKLMLDENTLRSIASYALSEALQGQAEMRWAKLSPSGEVLIKGLRFRDPRYLEENLLTADNVILKLSPFSLLYGEPKINELIFIAPRIECIKDKENGWNIRRYLAARKGKDSKNMAFFVHETHIRDGEIIIDNKASNIRHEFQKINFTLIDFSPDNDTSFEASSSFTIQGRKKEAEGRIFSRGTINMSSFDFSQAEIKDVTGKLVLNGKELPFSGKLTGFSSPTIKLKTSTPQFDHTNLDYLFDSAVDFSAPSQDWNLDISIPGGKEIAINAETDPLDITVSGSIALKTGTPKYSFSISAPPIPLEDLNKHINLVVEKPRGKVKPLLTIVSDSEGKAVLTDLTGDFTNSNFKYNGLSATGLDMLVHLTENLENSNLTVYDGRLQLGSQRINTLVLRGAISKKSMDVSFSGRLNSDPTKGKFVISNPFSHIKSVYYTGYSADIHYSTAKTLIFNLVDFFTKGERKRIRRFSQLDWVNKLRNSIPSGYSLFTIAYKAGMFRHEYLQAHNFYITLTMNSLSGRIENFKGSLSIKTGEGILFNVEDNSKKDHIHYLASMPLRFIDELNKKKAFKFSKLENVSFKSMGGDIKADKGIAVIENFYMEGEEFSACLTGEINFINETVDLKIYTIMDKYSRGVLPAGLTDASGKSALAFSLKGKMDSPVLNMLSPKDTSKRIAEAALKEPAVNFGKISRLLGGK